MIFVASKVSGYCGVMIVFDVKYMTLESVYDSIPSLSYIFSLAPIALYIIYQIVALASAISHCIVVLVVECIFYFP